MQTNINSPNSLPTGDQKDYVQKELDQIQAIISRMAANAFQCKGWAIGIVTIALAINKDTLMLSGWQSGLLMLPILVFWYLDGFFLYTEQCYRKLFSDVVKRRFTDNNWEFLFDYNYTRFEHDRVRLRGFWRAHIPVALGNTIERFPYWISFQLKNAPKLIPSIPTAMFSKTLLPFYILPTLFVCFAMYKGSQPIAEKPKDTLSVGVDSATLAPLLRALKQKQNEQYLNPVEDSIKK